MAPDAAAAKEFYGALFGWSHVDFPTDQGGVYTQFKSRDLPISARTSPSGNRASMSVQGS
jgi:predicted enzyme related to lactoylglutathione lyase